MKCKAKKTDGTRCGANAKDSGYCFTHDPASGAARAAARKLGGARNRIGHVGNAENIPAHVRSIDDVLKVLDYSLAETIPLENSIQKHYDKLSARERFALLVAAGLRGDYADRAALISSAPRKTFSVPNTYGLSDAFQFAAMWHVMTLANYEAAYYLCLAVTADDYQDEVGKDAAEGIPVILQKANIEFMAWRELCAEYGVDPDKLCESFPNAEGLDLFERMVIVSCDTPDAEEVTRNVNDMRGMIETLRKRWE